MTELGLIICAIVGGLGAVAFIAASSVLTFRGEGGALVGVLAANWLVLSLHTLGWIG